VRGAPRRNCAQPGWSSVPVCDAAPQPQSERRLRRWSARCGAQAITARSSLRSARRRTSWRRKPTSASCPDSSRIGRHHQSILTAACPPLPRCFRCQPGAQDGLHQPVHLQTARCRSGPAPPAQHPSQPGERQRVTSRARRREDDGTTRPNELKQRTRMLSAPIVPLRTACSHARCTISPVLCCARPMSQT
jgi:hypothetical protein